MSTSKSARRIRERRGRASELWAVCALICAGYMILARRHKTWAGEIDIIAVRGRRLAFVEVKSRRTFQEAELSVGARQRQRVRRAADLWLARHPRYASHDLAFDLVFIAPWRWPRHLENAL